MGLLFVSLVNYCHLLRETVLFVITQSCHQGGKTSLTSCLPELKMRVLYVHTKAYKIDSTANISFLFFVLEEF